MFSDLHDVEPGAELEFDVCIIGAGAAGISMALEFAGSRLSVALVESGGHEPEADTQALYAGESVGLTHFDLDQCRMRYFGGSTNCWNGWCAPFEEADFEPRPWIPWSGWPITRRDLEPYYTRAQRVCGLSGYADGDAMWSALGMRAPAFDPRKLQSCFFQHSTSSRFALVHRDAIDGANNVQVVLHANTTRISTNAAGTAVESIEVRTLDGRARRIRARHFVLACGGIENARLMLASRDHNPEGIGNARGLVGRFFMEHPYSICGMAMSRPSDLLPGREKRLNGVRLTAGLCTDTAAQRLEQCMGSMAILDPHQDVDALFEVGGGALEPAPEGLVRYALVAQSEQSPKPESRVTLSRDTDRFAMPRAALDWRMDEHDKRSIEVMTKLIGSEYARLGFGRVRVADWLREPEAYWGVLAGNHHMGTTRMGDDPTSSVVDADCCVHEVANLHVAGSSVFTTSSYVNPTFTIVALAIRLADHIKTLVI